jgi:uncharacterized membrane protein
MERFAGASLALATLTVGLMAGVYASFSFAVMPGLGRGDDRTFVLAMQHINIAILNGWFLLCFLGGLVFTVLAVVVHLVAGPRAVPWVIAGLALFVLTLVITGVVNVPLNNALVAAGSVDNGIDVHAVRVAFEARWVAWNITRSVLGTAAFGCLTLGLLRST